MSEAEERRLRALYGDDPLGIERGAAPRLAAPPAALNGRQPIPPAEPDPGWEPQWLDTLADSGGQPWIWEGFLARGATTFLTGLWKVGKTTFLAHLLRQLAADGVFCGFSCHAARVLVLSEEHRRHWIRRRDSLQLGPHIAIVNQPFLARPATPRWEQFVEYECAWARAQAIDLVVFDSLPNLWPVVDENAAPVVQAALAPLGRLQDADIATLCLMHPAKHEQDQGRNIRGSGALGGWADILVSLGRYDATQEADSRRVLSTLSRFDDAVPELVIDYDADTGYSPIGVRASVRERDREQAFLDLFPVADPDLHVAGITIDDALALWPGDLPKISRRTAFGYAEQLRAQGRLRRTGSGAKGNPYRFVAEA